MKHRFPIAFAFLASVLLFANTTAEAGGIEIGSKLENFKMMGTDGKEHSFNDLKGKNGAVIIFLSAQCPVVKAYISRIDEIAAEYKTKGINFIGINSNNRQAESLEWVTSDAAENFKFPMLIDTDNKLADQFGATVTPEVFFFDADNTLLYHGAIDNDRSGRNIQEKYLRTAFDSALSGKPIEKSKTNAFGCTIKRVGMEGKPAN
ncbi:thioredoxin family protein [Leptolyngbya sp. 7M]|uniref:thioredoxin family protein n=1 Tax=Leptolyngbya sp. 7M TaxID=2812896 RepID=UPI001B8C0212|nr:thioredoxin family protein [Leptolyngbya sp. 7M]QYO67182.1 thioredoxin family protein [Leptolyngbya sp. 7M]